MPHSQQAQEPLLSWLNHESGSLTAKLEAHTGAELKVIQQAWVEPSLWDKQVLGFKNQNLFRREVVMYSQHQPCWYARTIIPDACYQRDASFFNQLQTKPLTPLVYNEKKVLRTSLFHYAITAKCLEFYWVTAFNPLKTSPLWLRFSNFQFMKKDAFYLIEIFLPHFMRVINE